MDGLKENEVSAGLDEFYTITGFTAVGFNGEDLKELMRD
jgi:hypothetical protein